MRAPLPHQLPYRADIDGLRAVAILLVVGYHYYARHLPGGFIGVDVFFVISGFLISSLIFDAAQENKFSYREFYGRRFRRLLPALLLVLISVLVAGAFMLYPTGYRQLNRLLISAIFFIPNFMVWTQTGYFSGNPNQTPLLHLWSLGVEEQFYLFWPLLVTSFWNRGIPWIIGFLATTSFAAGVLLIGKYPDAVFYFPFARLWELLGGSYLAWRERRHLHSALGMATDLPIWLRELFSVFGLAILIGCGTFMASSLTFPGWWALPPVLATMMIISAGPHTWINRNVLAHRAAVGIGLISYPLYLWHWPIRSFLNISGSDLSSVHRTVALLFAFVLAWLTYHFVEKPIRRQKPGFFRQKVSWGLLTGGLLLALVSEVVNATAGLPGRYPANLRPFMTYQYPQASQHACFLEPLQSGSDWDESKCVTPQTRPGEPLLILWGDSHAAHLRPGLDLLQHERTFRLGEMTEGGCPPLVHVDVPGYPSCRGINDFFLSKIIQLRPEAVVLSALWPDQVKSIRQTIEALRAAGIRHIIVIGPTPRWNDSLPDILVHEGLLNDLANRHYIPQRLGPDLYGIGPEAKLKIEAEQKGAFYISAIDALCPVNQCIAMTNYGPEYVTFADSNHLTIAGSDFLISKIADQIFAGIDVAKR